MERNTAVDSNSICKWIFESASFGVITTDKLLKITNVNHWFELSSEKPNDHLTGTFLLESFPEIIQRKLDHYFTEALTGASVILSSRFHKFVFQFPSPLENDEGFMQQTVRVSPLICDNEITGIIILIEDTTERIRREEQLLRINEELQILNSTKDKFFRIIAHDLRSPFNVLLGFSELLRDDETLSPEEAHGIVKNLHSALKNQYTFLDNLLKWALIQSGKFEISPQEVALREVIESMLNIIDSSAKSKQINIIVNLTHNASIFIDKQSLTTILYNLVFNAIKFTNAGGTIEIGASLNKGNSLFYVKDNGQGISKEMIGKLFRIEETFTTPGTNYEKGSGLGLILCKDIVEKLGGRIWVESLPGQGSTFFFSIPDNNLKEQLLRH